MTAGLKRQRAFSSGSSPESTPAMPSLTGGSSPSIKPRSRSGSRPRARTNSASADAGGACPRRASTPPNRADRHNGAKKGSLTRFFPQCNSMLGRLPCGVVNVYPFRSRFRVISGLTKAAFLSDEIMNEMEMVSEERAVFSRVSTKLLLQRPGIRSHSGGERCPCVSRRRLCRGEKQLPLQDLKGAVQ